jgi:hypothetical protein
MTHKAVVSQFAEMFQTCPAERRASPGEAGISASRSIPKMCPLPCSFREFSSMHFGLESCCGSKMTLSR